MMIDSDIIVMVTHGFILATAVVSAVSSILNRKKLNKIDVSINGRLADKIKQAIKEAKEGES